VVVGDAGTVTVVVGTGPAGAVMVRVGVCTVMLVELELVTVEVTGLVTALACFPPLSETASAIPTPAATATTPATTSGQTRDCRERIFAPQVGQNSAPGGTLDPQFAHSRFGPGPCPAGSSLVPLNRKTSSATRDGAESPGWHDFAP
jgi:hypothetical protein